MDTPNVLDGPTIGAGIVTIIGAVYAIFGHNGLTDAQSHGIVALVVTVYAFGLLIYHAVKVHALSSSPAAFALYASTQAQGDGPPVKA